MRGRSAGHSAGHFRGLLLRERFLFVMFVSILTISLIVTFDYVVASKFSVNQQSKFYPSNLHLTNARASSEHTAISREMLKSK